MGSLRSCLAPHGAGIPALGQQDWCFWGDCSRLVVLSYSQGHGNVPREPPPTLVPGNIPIGGASTLTGMSSGHRSLQEAQKTLL